MTTYTRRKTVEIPVQTMAALVSERLAYLGARDDVERVAQLQGPGYTIADYRHGQRRTRVDLPVVQQEVR